MSVRIHIERLVVDRTVLPREREGEFRAALASELAALRHASAASARIAPDPMIRLARQTAAVIHDRLPRA